MTETPVPRPAGKRGVKLVGDVPELRLENFRAAAPAPPPPAGDVSHGMTVWGMLGNDNYSDCGAAMVEHARMAKAVIGVNPDGTGIFPAGFVAPTEANTLATYFAYGLAQGEPGPDPDEGVSNPTWLKYLFDVTGGVIPKPEGDDIEEWGFAQIDPGSPAEVEAAMLNFSGVLIAVHLTDDAEQDFSNHVPWNVTATDQPDPTMGHDILLAKYDASGYTFITWGAPQLATVSFDQRAIVEAWVFITAEDAARNEVDMAALKAAITAWGGTVGAPTPALSQSASEVHKLATEALDVAHQVVLDAEAAIRDVKAKFHGFF